jgi:lipid-A-disaccharide synthase-like uncharacterized protein
MNNIIIFAIGFIAQGFFSARMLLQWILSEKRKEIVSPVVYWVCSLCGSILLFVYGSLRNDFSIVLGQLISYYIYVWNLDIKGVWNKLPLAVRVVLFALPIGALAYLLGDAEYFFRSFFRNPKVPLWLLLYGSAGQIIFTLRFIYQWYYSYRRHRSILPVGFWIISLVGSGIIVSYAIYRLDPVLILGQSVGFITYSRNIMIGRKSQKKQ